MIRSLRIMGLVLLLVLATNGESFGDIDFSDYHSPAEVEQILNDLVAAYPGLAQVSSIGPSYGGLPIRVLKISDNVATDDPDEDDILFVAAHHAREWITVEMALYLAEQILKNYSTDPQLQADVNNLEIWIIPIVNPDGVAYTWSPTGYRYWRKNRRDNGDGTYGVDLNRNYGYQWGLSSGSSGSTYSEVYRGTAPFSEPESNAIRLFAEGLDNLETMLTYHNYSELYLRPWAYTFADAPGEETLRQLALRCISLVQAVHGHTYGETIWYTCSGETTDWFWGVHRISAFTPELRPDYDALEAFSPPPSEIMPCNEENWPAARALIHYAGSTELWMADHATDNGSEPSSFWNGAHWSPAFWVSPDIWTDPATLDQGATVDLNVRIRNNTGSTQHNVRLDVYYTDPTISTEFPNPGATLIASQTGLTVPSVGKTVTMPWTVPVGTNSWGERHWCLGAIVMHDDDLPLTTVPQRSSNVAMRNVTTTETVVGTNLMVTATNFLSSDAELRVIVDDLPQGWKVVLPRPPRPDTLQALTPIERKARLLKAKGQLLRPGETVFLPVRVTPPPGAASGDTVQVHIHGALLPLTAGERTAAGTGFTYRVVIP